MLIIIKDNIISVINVNNIKLFIFKTIKYNLIIYLFLFEHFI